MKIFSLLSVCIVLVTCLLFGCTEKKDQETSLLPIDQIDKKINVFICVDMEGMGGIVHVKDCNEGGMDYERFRESATREVNVAINAAFKGGASRVVVRDAHESMRNLIPELLDPRAELIRGGDGSNPEIMLQGIEQGFDVLFFVGHHAGAGTPRGVLAHTMVVDGVQEFSINGIQIPEMAYCALIANKYGVPVGYFSGDDVACAQAREFFGNNLVTTETKKAMGWKVARCFHPSIVHKRIDKDVKRAMKKRDFTYFKMNPPFNCYLRVKSGNDVNGNPILNEYSWQSGNINDAFAYFWDRI